MRTTRAIAVLTLASVAVLGSTACGSDDSTRGAAGAAQQDGAASSAPLTTADFADRVIEAADAAGSVSATMTTSGSGISITIATDSRRVDGEGEYRIVMSYDSYLSVEMRLVDGIAYVSAGDSAEGKFEAVDPDDASSEYADIYAEIREQGGTNAMLDQLDGSIVSVDAVGEVENLDGVEVQRYDVVIDTAAASAGSTSTSMPEQATFVYWIDADDLWHKVSVEMDGITVEGTATNWGGEVDITAPTADELVS